MQKVLPEVHHTHKDETRGNADMSCENITCKAKNPKSQICDHKCDNHDVHCTRKDETRGEDVSGKAKNPKSQFRDHECDDHDGVNNVHCTHKDETRGNTNIYCEHITCNAKKPKSSQIGDHDLEHDDYNDVDNIHCIHKWETNGEDIAHKVEKLRYSRSQHDDNHDVCFYKGFKLWKQELLTSRIRRQLAA
ncbi:hypothetical protein V8E55_010017 [Tylopilus felleus]